MTFSRIALLLFACSSCIAAASANPLERNRMPNVPHLSSLAPLEHDPKYSLLPNPKDMAMLFTNGTEKEQRAFDYMYQSMLSQFDVEGYNWLMNEVMEESNSHRFLQALSKVDNSQPHCDKGQQGAPGPAVSGNAPFPGGPIRRTFGFDLSQWITNMLMSVQSQASSSSPGIANMAIQSLLMVKGMIQSIAATVLDIVPPMIPPPVWILRPLPCLPMLTGMNCLGSVLYPITISDFVTADVTDSVMGGVISSFPAKYAAKVGKTSETQYRICAAAYLGMYCASIFPICWLPIGLQEVQTFPVCFPQCLASLIACPGFWIDDIMGPCSSVSVPPFCSFSLFINHKLIAPQYTSYEQGHPFPQDCPKYDPLYDTADDLYDVVLPLPSPIEEASKEKAPELPYFPPLGKTLSDYANVVVPEHVEPKCDCSCKLKTGIPVKVKGDSTRSATTYETPCNLSDIELRCHKICEEKWKAEKPPTPTKRPLAKRLPVLLTKKAPYGSKLGHVIPVEGATSAQLPTLARA